MFVGDVGTVIKLNAGTDISSASTKKIRAKKPGGTLVEWTAALEGTDYLTYTTQASDIDESGIWEFQIYVVLSSWQGYGAVAEHRVLDPLAA